MQCSQREGVYIETLGCPKNVADSEGFKKRLVLAGVPVKDSPEEAEFIIVNTCGFIEDAKRESIEEILRLASFKQKIRTRRFTHATNTSTVTFTNNNVEKAVPKLVVMGCLVKRYFRELKKELPEVDAFFGVNEEDNIIAYLKSNSSTISGDSNRCDSFGLETVSFVTNKVKAGLKSSKGFQLLPSPPYAYLKISDGCNRKCSFCVIPKIKGPYWSIEPDKIIREAQELISKGYKELILVGQEISSYGRDRRDFPSLRDLIKEITGIPGDFWVRLLYLHPASITEELLEEVASNNKVCKYLDIPLQHSEDRILRLMRRPGSKEQYRRLIKRIRSIIPDVTIRTTFIVGFPGETDGDFNGLIDFIKEIEFDRLGVFKYSREEGTPAFNFKGQLPDKIKKKRYDEIMKLQAEISLRKNLSLVGKKMRCLIDYKGLGRLQSQAPEIDGMVLLNSTSISDFVDVIITRAYEYDLEGLVAK